MDKYAMVYSYSEILPNNKNKWYPDIHNISETQKHGPMQKKPNRKEYILCDSVGMTL